MQLLVVGYGTLLLKSSLGSSVGRVAADTKEFLPVWVDGYRRLFNLRPDHYQSTNRLSGMGNECGALNVEASAGARLNAVVFHATTEELDALDLRERCYDRAEVRVFSFAANKPMGSAFIYTAPLDSPRLVRDMAGLMPSWRDVVWARTGAYQVSEAFGLQFDATTYMADGKTLMIDIYRGLLKDASDVSMPLPSLEYTRQII